jgi:hypothetical protein
MYAQFSSVAANDSFLKFTIGCERFMKGYRANLKVFEKIRKKFIKQLAFTNRIQIENMYSGQGTMGRRSPKDSN